MKKDRNDLKKILCIGAAVFLITTAFLPLGQSDFFLPLQGGGMVHCDPQMSENIRLSVPTTNVGEVWYRHDLGGELVGSIGIGIAGNGRIAASTFGPWNVIGQNDNLIIYDYYGNHLWSSGWWYPFNLSNPGNTTEYPWSLNPVACSSVPMIDIYDRVVACDYQKIILVNASDHNNIHVEWITYLPGGLTASGGFPISPTIVEDKTIILPTKSGPLYAFDAQTGNLIANITLGQNTSIDPYWGVPEMNWSNFLTIMTTPLPYPLACPFHYNSSSNIVEWNSSVPYGIIPFNPPFYEGNIMFQRVLSDQRYVYAYDMTTDTTLTYNMIEDAGYYTGEGYFSTLNSACVQGKKVFIATEYKKPGTLPINNTIGRLYAIDVNPDAENESDRLKENWSYTYFGSSQASPTLINDTIYFDGYNSTLLQENRDPHIYAVYTNGTEKWKISYPNMTWFSFAMDPRGGFWYEDSDQIRSWFSNNTGGNKLVRFRENNGSIMEEIDMKTLLNDTGPYGNESVLPCSCMTTCGTDTNPIMLMSANHPRFKPGKWVLAINLSYKNNTVIWKVPINSSLHFNYAGGQYTILNESNQYRVLFGTYVGGVMAIGTYPNTWFQTIGHSLKDSPGDYNTYNDTVQINYTIKSVIPDRVFVKAMLVSVEHPILCKYSAPEKHYNATPEGLVDSINITLPPWAPKGNYTLQGFLYNSSGEIKDIVYNPLNLEFLNRLYANQTYNPDSFSMYPLNDPPETPQQPWVSDVINNLTMTFATNTTDPNGDEIWYQWRYDTGLGFTYYTRWIAGGPHETGENCYRTIGWWFPGTYQVQVRAKDNILQPNVITEWSEPYNITVTKNQGAPVKWDNEFLGQFTQTILTPTQQTGCTGFAEGVFVQTQTRESLNWNWSFGDGTYSEEQNVTHNYSQLGTYVVNLTLENGDGEFYNCTTNVSVIVLKSDFTITGGQPETDILYSDTSTGEYSLTNWTWGFGDGNGSYQQNPVHNYVASGFYNVSLTVKDNQNNTHVSNQTLYIESVRPQYVSIVDYPDPIGFGQNVTIEVNVFDNLSGIEAVYINIMYPDNETTGNFSMEANMSSSCDYSYVFNDNCQNGVYNYSIWVVDNADNTNWTSEIGKFTIDFEDPQMTMVTASPHNVGFGYNVTVTANVTDSETGVNTVHVNITYPDEKQMNYTMTHIMGDTYQYVFTDTWLAGQYDYTIWVMDSSSNSNSSSGHHLHVSADATINIATLQDSYTGNEQINITDPPNPLENLTLVGRGLTWNTYYNALTGQNILEATAGPINYQEDNDTWTPINTTLCSLPSNHPAYIIGYRTGNNHGLYGLYFKSNAQLDWPVAFTYNRSDDPTTYAVRSKLMGVGYVDPASDWAYEYLQNVQSSQGQTTDNMITYEDVFTGTDVTWSYGNTGLKEEIILSNTTKTVLQNHPPSLYGLQNASSYLVFITKLDYHNLNIYNASGVLTGNITISDTGVDFKDAFEVFKCALPLGAAYEMNNESTWQKLTYRIIHLNGTTYLLSGLRISDLITMTFPVVIDPTLTIYSTSSDGHISNSGTTYNTVRTASSGTVSDTASFFTIGQNKASGFPGSYSIYRGFVYFNTSSIPSNAYLDNATLSVCKKDDYSTTDFDITIQNGQPTYPHDPLQTGDYSYTNYAGNGGTLNTSGFTSGYNDITINNLSWINMTGITKVCLRSSRDINGNTPTGNEYVNVYANEFLGTGYQPKLVIMYRNQSKIKNTGSTDIKGFLLIQIQFYNSTQDIWVVDTDKFNETTPRTITSSSQLALDSIFNGKINASDLQHGTGTYRVYAAYRDPEGTILRTNDGLELDAWWEFTKT